MRLRERVRAPAPKSGLDYGDAVRADGLGPGGLLKEGFEGRVTNGLGGTVLWRNNAEGFRRSEDTPETPAPGVVRVLSMGDSFTAGIAWTRRRRSPACSKRTSPRAAPRRS